MIKKKIQNIFYNFLGSKYYPTFELGKENWFKIKNGKGQVHIFKARVDKIIVDKKGDAPTLYADNNPIHALKPEQFIINICVTIDE